MTGDQLSYPAARTVEVRETVAGLSFPDPYRWLEADSSESEAWQQAQNALTDAVLGQWPHLAALRSSVDRYVADGTGSANWMVDPAPRFAGGRWFRLDRTPGPGYPDRAVLVISDDPDSPGRVRYDPAQDGDRQISWFAPSPEGRIALIGVCRNGSDLGEIRLLDAEMGDRLPDRIPQPTLGPMILPQWLPDSSGFFYTAGDLSAESFAFRIWFHEIGSEPPAEPEPVSAGEGPAVQVSADGKRAVLTGVWPLPQYVCDLPERNWRPFLQNLDASVAGVVDGARYVAVTDHGAPRGRIVAISFDDPDPAAWRELVPESERVLSHVRLIGGRLVVTGSVGAEARAWVLDRDGRELEEVPLPGRGALPLGVLPNAALAPDGHPEWRRRNASATDSRHRVRRRAGHLPPARRRRSRHRLGRCRTSELQAEQPRRPLRDRRTSRRHRRHRRRPARRDRVEQRRLAGGRRVRPAPGPVGGDRGAMPAARPRRCPSPALRPVRCRRGVRRPRRSRRGRLASPGCRRASSSRTTWPIRRSTCTRAAPTPHARPGPTRKFVARVQASAVTTAPVLLRVWDGVGHGTASSRSEAVTHATCWLAFLISDSA